MSVEETEISDLYGSVGGEVDDQGYFYMGVKSDGYTPLEGGGERETTSPVKLEEKQLSAEEATCQSIVSRILASHSDFVQDLLNEIDKSVPENLSRFSAKNLSLKRLMNALSATIVNQLQTRDVSVSQRIAKCIEDRFIKPVDENSNLESLTAALYNEFSDFLQIASRVAEFIISERRLPPSSKLIKPSQIGGIAGGDKFIAESMLFKISRDPEVRAGKYLYSGTSEPRDDYAMKAAAQELLGASHYFIQFVEQEPPLQIIPALQSLMDFKGYRVVAMPLLPISSATLVYGSDNAGSNFHCKNEMVVQKMREAAQTLHIAEHEFLGNKLYSAADVEVHKAEDGRFYLLDLARCFPPESPTVVFELTGSKKSNTSVFFRMLRPEALQYWKGKNPDENFPLSPDAFTRFSIGDSKTEFHDSNLQKATRFVLVELVDNFVKDFISLVENESTYDVELSVFFHQHGLNIRHLGIVCEHLFKVTKSLTDTHTHQVFTTVSCEIIYRALKNRLRRILRDNCEVSDSTQKFLIVQLVNESFESFCSSNYSPSERLASLASTVTECFLAPALEFISEASVFVLWRSQLSKIFIRVLDRCGVRLLDTTRSRWMKANPKEFPLKLHSLEISSFFSIQFKLPVLDMGQADCLSHAADSFARSRQLSSSFALRSRCITLLRSCLGRFPLFPALKQLLLCQRVLHLADLNAYSIEDFTHEERLFALPKLVHVYDLRSLLHYSQEIQDLELHRFPGLLLSLLFRELKSSGTSESPLASMVVELLDKSLSAGLMDFSLDVSLVEFLALLQLCHCKEIASGDFLKQFVKGGGISASNVLALLDKVRGSSVMSAIMMGTGARRMVTLSESELKVLMKTKLVAAENQVIYLNEIMPFHCHELMCLMVKFPLEFDSVFSSVRKIQLPCSPLLWLVLQIDENDYHPIKIDEEFWRKDVIVDEHRSEASYDIVVTFSGDVKTLAQEFSYTDLKLSFFVDETLSEENVVQAKKIKKGSTSGLQYVFSSSLNAGWYKPGMRFIISIFGCVFYKTPGVPDNLKSVPFMGKTLVDIDKIADFFFDLYESKMQKKKDKEAAAVSMSKSNHFWNFASNRKSKSKSKKHDQGSDKMESKEDDDSEKKN
jgi:hypothetical protein